MLPRHKDIGRLLLNCPDRRGVIAAVSTFLTRSGANIISLDQHSTAPEGGTFLQRTVFHLPGLAAAQPDLEHEFQSVAEEFGMNYRFTDASKPKRVAIMASTADHCLLDLLWRNRRGELDMTVVMVISNHADLAEQVGLDVFGVGEHHRPDFTVSAPAVVLAAAAARVTGVELVAASDVDNPLTGLFGAAKTYGRRTHPEDPRTRGDCVAPRRGDHDLGRSRAGERSPERCDLRPPAPGRRDRRRGIPAHGYLA